MASMIFVSLLVIGVTIAQIVIIVIAVLVFVNFAFGDLIQRKFPKKKEPN